MKPMFTAAGPDPLALAIATTSARMHQAATSFIAAHTNAVTPKGDLIIPRSSRMRAKAREKR